jgi:hypothetical protein
MSLKLQVVASEDEFDDIWPMHFQAFHNPYNTFSKFFNPIHTTLDAAIEASKARHIKMWKGSANCYWIKVTEANTSEVLGAACWIHDNDPPQNPHVQPVNATWHIDGSDEKAFAEKLIGGLKSFLAERMTRPHFGKLGHGYHTLNV